MQLKLRAFASRPSQSAYLLQDIDMSPDDRAQALRAAPPDGWVAFSADESRLIAYGKTYDEAVAKAEQNGEPDPVLVKVPKDWSMQVL